MFLQKLNTLSVFALFSYLPLMAENNVASSVPNVPEFSITYEGDKLVCSPIELIKTKIQKDLVRYECQKAYATQVIEKDREEQRGHAETQRLKSDVKNKMSKGLVYSVEIPLTDADSPTRRKIIALRQLEKKPDGKYLRMLLPAKLYVSIRPQLTNSNDDGKLELTNGGSRGGFYYYYQFNEDLELTFQYEAGVDLNADTRFINASDASNTNRRLSYFALKYFDNSFIAGKYWSAYYDIAGFTDQFIAYGAQASGAFSSEPSGTGRADKMLQLRRENEIYNLTLQTQFRHDTLNNWNTDYDFTLGGSIVYKGLEDYKLGAAINFGRFDEINPQMQSDGIVGDDFSSIIGLTYKKNSFGVSSVLSYTKNHMSDDQGIYFNGVGAELYMQYDIDENIRIAGGGNWLFPEDDEYKGKYSVNDLILSFQYTFGERTFDDMVYVELSLPNGKFADGEKKDASIAIGLRYLLDY